jgi:integrase
MATIENRSRTQITVKSRDDLTKLFPHTKNKAARAYREELIRAGLKPVVRLLDEAYSVRFKVNGKRKNFTANSEEEAIAIAKRIESEQYHGLFVDYTAAHRISLADLLIRYLHEQAPRTKGFLVTGYQINRWLEDAGLPRQDLAAIHKQHPSPKVANLHIPIRSGRRMSEVCEAASFIRTSFAALEPDDFQTFIDERLQVAQPPTVDRELDVFRSVCTLAINKWRIPVKIHPMAGLGSPQYHNERDRRLVGDEYDRLIAAAYADDRECAIEARVQELLATTHPEKSATKYQRAKLLAAVRKEAENSYQHVAWYQTFIEFQLMAGPRRGETLNLKWSHVNLDEQTAFFPETKNGHSRSLPLRADLVAMLRDLPRESESDNLFQFSVPQLRKAWARICAAAKIPTTGDNTLHIHDLRHEAISRVAEAGSNTPGGFTLLDLQAFSGHRDVRMLSRYANLMPKALANRLDAAFKDSHQHTIHNGRKRLSKNSELKMAEIVTTPLIGERGSDASVATEANEPLPAIAATHSRDDSDSTNGKVLYVNFRQHDRAMPAPEEEISIHFNATDEHPERRAFAGASTDSAPPSPDAGERNVNIWSAA